MQYQTPSDAPEDLKSFRDWVIDEFRNLSDATTEPEPDTLLLKEWNAEPDKLYNGLVAYADGTNWNPGGGRGLYIYQDGLWILDDWNDVASGVGFVNSWVNFGGVHQVAEFMIDPWGWVHLRGLIKTGTINSVIYTLPVGFRPANTEIFDVNRNDGTTAGISGRIDVITSGVVAQANAPGSNSYLSLAGIQFQI
jgi:hypothetical protein